MSSKTPVSIIQELSAQLKISPPQYDLILDKPEGTSPDFKYRVTFNGIAAVGCGRSKKEAKHNAAELCYAKYQESELKTCIKSEVSMLADPPVVSSPFNKQVLRNYIGELSTLCATHDVRQPEYTEVASEGPSHAPLFTISCKLSQFEEKAQASAKKQAKQLAAKKMINRIEDNIQCLPKNPQACATGEPAAEEIERVFERISAVAPLPATMLPSCKIGERHLLMQAIYQVPEALTQVMLDKGRSNWDPVERLEQVISELKLSCEYQIDHLTIPFSKNGQCLSNEAEKTWLAIVVVDTKPRTVIMDFGCSATHAKKCAAEKTLSHFSVMLEGATIGNSTFSVR